MADIVYKGIALPTISNPFPSIKAENDLIRDSIITILMTRIGQRFFVPDFGSRLYDVLFEPNDAVTRALAERYIREALGTWEPRIQVESILIGSEEHTLYIKLYYRVIRLNQIFELQLDISRDTFTVVDMRIG